MSNLHPLDTEEAEQDVIQADLTALTSTVGTNTGNITTLNGLKPTITKLNETAGATAIFTDTDVVTIYVDLSAYATPYYTLGSNAASEYISSIEIIKANTGSSETHNFKIASDAAASSPYHFGILTEDTVGTYSPVDIGAITKFTLTPAASTGHSSYRGEILWGDVSALSFAICCTVYKY